MDAEQYYSELEEKRTDEFNAEKNRISMKRLGIAFVTFRDERMTAVWVNNSMTSSSSNDTNPVTAGRNHKKTQRQVLLSTDAAFLYILFCFQALWRTTAACTAVADPSSQASPLWCSRTNGGSAMHLLLVTSSGQYEHYWNANPFLLVLYKHQWPQYSSSVFSHMDRSLFTVTFTPKGHLLC